MADFSQQGPPVTLPVLRCEFSVKASSGLMQRQSLLADTYLLVKSPLSGQDMDSNWDYEVRLGWPIVSGVIEGACRHLVKDRLELNAGPRKELKTSCISALSPKTMTGMTTMPFAGNKGISASTLLHTHHKDHWNIWRLIQPRNHLPSSYFPGTLRGNTNSLTLGLRDLPLKRFSTRLAFYHDVKSSLLKML